MIGFLGGRPSRRADRTAADGARESEPTLPPLPPELPPPVHTIAPPPLPRAATPATGLAMPPPLPPRRTSEPDRPPAPQSGPYGGPPPVDMALDMPPPDPATTPSQAYVLIRQLFDAREAVATELAAVSKEFQVLRSLKDSDLDVCQDLASELTRRLQGHPLYQSLGRINEAYSLALRYRRPE